MSSCNQCDNEFTPKQRTQKFCSKVCKIEYNKYTDNVCGVCEKEYRGIKGRKYCSTECRATTTREERCCKLCDTKFTERVKHKREFCSDVCRMGWMNIPENREKQQKSIKKTVKEKYGVDHVWNVKEIHEKTMVNRDTETSIRKQKETVRVKHLELLTKRLFKNDLIIVDDYINNKDGNTSRHYTFHCLMCDNSFTSTVLGSGMVPICRVCKPIITNPKSEIKLEQFLISNGINYIKNDRKVISPMELDFYIPEHNLAIELNGLYWHSEGNGKDKNYHLKKTDLCKDKHIKLIHIFSDELDNYELILSRLRNLLKITPNKIHGRKCVVKVLDYKTKKVFLTQNHIQGDTKSGINLGLYHNDLLVSVMTFGKRKITQGESNWELIRFASLINNNVNGGMSKLLKHFIGMGLTDRLFTYADIRWSGNNITENGYNKNEFKFIKQSPPNYWYTKVGYNTREHRYNYRKSVLVGKGFDPNKTEWEIMRENGYDRIWDCGTMKFELTF